MQEDAAPTTSPAGSASAVAAATAAANADAAAAASIANSIAASAAAAANMPSSPFYPMLDPGLVGAFDKLEPWASLPYPAAYFPYEGPMPGYPFPHAYGMDLNGARRKNATRETTSMLKAWLSEHRKNPYPTKGEKIMLAIVTKMTLTQVSTWFANARRRLKKENKMTWSPRNRCEEDEQADAEAEKSESSPAGSTSHRRSPSSPSRRGDGRSGGAGAGDDDDSDIVDIEDESDQDSDAPHDGSMSQHSSHQPSSAKRIRLSTSPPLLSSHPQHPANSSSCFSSFPAFPAHHHLQNSSHASAAAAAAAAAAAQAAAFHHHPSFHPSAYHLIQQQMQLHHQQQQQQQHHAIKLESNHHHNSISTTSCHSSKPRIWSIADMATSSTNDRREKQPACEPR